MLKVYIPSKINCIERAQSKIAIILENTCNNLLFINFSYLIVIIKDRRVISITISKASICKRIILMFSYLMELDNTITEVMDAGPASKGTASG